MFKGSGGLPHKNQKPRITSFGRNQAHLRPTHTRHKRQTTRGLPGELHVHILQVPVLSQVPLKPIHSHRLHPRSQPQPPIHQPSSGFGRHTPAPVPALADRGSMSLHCSCARMRCISWLYGGEATDSQSKPPQLPPGPFRQACHT